MQTHADKNPEDSGKAVANNVSQQRGSSKAAVGFLDHQPKTPANNTGLPDRLKTGVESLSGLSMDHVKVHYNSDKPAQLNAHAYAQGSDIHVALGQERHLPHEAWHVVQQAQGRVKPTMQLRENIAVNNDVELEKEADNMGSKSLQTTHQLKLKTPAINNSTLQLNEDGRWWGTAIGGALGGMAGAAVGYTSGAMSAATGFITGGVADAVKGYQHEGLTGALKWGAAGAVSNAVAGFSGSTLHGASVGMKLGSALGSGIGDWWTGRDPIQQRHIEDIAEKMRAHLKELTEAKPVIKEGLKAAQDGVPGNVDEKEIRLLNWMYESLGIARFNEVARGGQVRVPFSQNVFSTLIDLGAQKRQSSHYSGLLFPSGFSQVTGEQYGTKGDYLPTVLFGKILDRQERPFMYFQPEGHAFNPDTGWREKLSHVKDAYKYAVHGVQQGPHGTSLRTDADPITDSNKYQPTFSDKFGYARAADFEAFAANLLYTSGGNRILSIAPTSNEFRVGAMQLLAKAGLYGAAYLAWKKFN